MTSGTYVPASPSTAPRGLWRDVAIGLVLAAATFAVYAPTLGHPFVRYDDGGYIFENPHVLGGLTLDGLAWAFTSLSTTNWHPLTWLSHMADVQLFGLWAGGHHLVSVLLHIASTLLLYGVLRRMTAAMPARHSLGGGVWPSALVAALFALHPLHVESVAWASERKDVLSTFFAMLTLWAYAWYAVRPGPPRRVFDVARYALVFGLFALGLMAKPMLVTLPLVLLLLDFWPLGRSQRMGWGRLVLEKLPLLALSAASGVLTLIAQQAGGAVATLECVPFALRLQNAFISILAYIGKMFWPADLAFFYPFRHEIPLWQLVYGGTAVVLLTAFALSQARRRPYLAVGWFWYVITLMPVIGIVQVGGQALADRFTYVPLIGIFMAVAWAAAEWVGPSRARGVGAAAAAALVILGCLVTAAAQVRTWADSRTLFMHAIAVTSNNYVAHSGLGNLLLAEGEPDEAAYHLYQAVRGYWIDPVLHNDLGVALARCGHIAPAEAAFRDALSLKPDYADAHENLGWLMAQEGRLDEAATHLREALRLAPDNRQACEYLVDVLTRQGKLEEAAAVAREHGYVAGHGGRSQRSPAPPRRIFDKAGRAAPAAGSS